MDNGNHRSSIDDNSCNCDLIAPNHDITCGHFVCTNSNVTKILRTLKVATSDSILFTHHNGHIIINGASNRFRKLSTTYWFYIESDMFQSLHLTNFRFVTKYMLERTKMADKKAGWTDKKCVKWYQHIYGDKFSCQYETVYFNEGGMLCGSGAQQSVGVPHIINQKPTEVIPSTTNRQLDEVPVTKSEHQQCDTTTIQSDNIHTMHITDENVDLRTLDIPDTVIEFHTTIAVGPAFIMRLPRTLKRLSLPKTTFTMAHVNMLPPTLESLTIADASCMGITSYLPDTLNDLQYTKPGSIPPIHELRDLRELKKRGSY